MLTVVSRCLKVEESIGRKVKEPKKVLIVLQDRGLDFIQSSCTVLNVRQKALHV